MMNTERGKFGLAAKFSILVSLPVLIGALVLSNSFTRHNLRQIEIKMIERGKSVARGLARSSEYGLMIGNENILKGIVDNYTDEEDVVYISIMDKSGERLASYGDAGKSSPIKIIADDPPADELETRSECHVSETKLLYDIVCDVIAIQVTRNREDIGDMLSGSESREVKKIGTVQIGLSKASMISSMRRSKIRALWLTILIVSPAILATFIIVRLMLKPIKRLSVAAGAVSQGDFEHLVEVKSRDEIGHLAGSFNKMVVDLKISSEALQYRLEIEETIAAISTKFMDLAPREVDNGIDYALQTIGKATHADLSYVFLLSDDGERVEKVYEWYDEGIETRDYDSAMRGLSAETRSWWTEALQQFGRIHVPNVDELPPEADTMKDFIKSKGIRSFVIVPMLYGGASVGVLGCSSVRVERAWTKEDITLLKMVGEIFVNALERRQAEEELQHRLEVEERMTGELKREVDERKRTEEELARSNAELQSFAYVASHDLQEPLRMVASYLQLLERRYKGKLDDDADDFINYAVDGATRMQRLINDLLKYSRVSTQAKEFEPTNCETVLENTLSNLQIAIKESEAVVAHDPLPNVMADNIQLGQLLQNLIGNAIKFRNEKPPRIHVSAKQKEGEWTFSVQDNGIGIDPDYKDRIFVIFQRLHGVGDYPGTGIGLAICKRIVEHHGGRIWLESQPGEGCTFYFTIPVTGEQ